MVGLIVRVVRERFTAFALLAGLGLSIVLILAANVAIGAVREWMTHWRVSGTAMITVLDALTTVTLNALAFASLYRWLPKRPVLWRDAWRGGLLVSLTWEVGRQVLSAFLIGMRYTTAYGAIGSFIALLLWFYWGVTILFFGAEYVQVLSRRHARPLTMFRPSPRKMELLAEPMVRLASQPSSAPMAESGTSTEGIASSIPVSTIRVKSPPRRRAA
ncbi:MAG: YihY/virulence factor BrkB family protein [Pirellulaceae bacterium]